MSPERLLEIACVEQRRQLIRREPYARPCRARCQARRRNPLPRRTMTRREMPSGRDMRRAAPRFGDHLARHEQAELDAHAGEPDPFAARLGARRDVVVSGQSRRCIPRPSSTMVSVAVEASVSSRTRVAPESSALATTSVRIVSSSAPVYASRRSSRRCWRSTRVSPTRTSYPGVSSRIACSRIPKWSGALVTGYGAEPYTLSTPPDAAIRTMTCGLSKARTRIRRDASSLTATSARAESGH